MKKLIVGCIALVIMSLVFGCAKPASAPKPAPAPAPAPSPAPAPAPGQVTTWTFVVNPAASSISWFFTPYPYYQDMLEKATGGRLKISTKVALVTQAETPQAVRDGRADLGQVWAPIVSGSFPLWDFGSLPFFFQNNPLEYKKAVNDPRLAQLLDASYQDAGLIRLGSITSGRGDALFSKKLLATANDFKGLKIRAMGVLDALALKKMGAAPLVVPVAEAGDAMRLGTVEAILSGVSFGLTNLGMADVATNLSWWQFMSDYGGAIVVNPKSFNALPKDLQDIVRKVTLEFQDQELCGTYIFNQTERSVVTASKLKITQPDKAEIEKAVALIKPMVDEWIASAGPRAKDVLAISSEYATGPLMK